MKKADLIKLVTEIKEVKGKTEKEIDALIEVLKSNVPHPEVTDLIYFDDLTPKEIVEKALNYKPISL